MRPILKRRLSEHFGRQRMFNGVAKRPKHGVDIAAPVGVIVRAPAGGIVTLSAEFYYSGHTLILGHGFDVSSIFLHSCEVLIKPGDEVKQGDIIGKVGATGRVTGLHWIGV